MRPQLEAILRDYINERESEGGIGYQSTAMIEKRYGQLASVTERKAVVEFLPGSKRRPSAWESGFCAAEESPIGRSRVD